MTHSSAEDKYVYIGILKSWLDKLHLNDLTGGLLNRKKNVNFAKLSLYLNNNFLFFNYFFFACS